MEDRADRAGSRQWGNLPSDRLRERIARPIGYEKQKISAVIIPLVQADSELQVLFEVRARSLKTQPGEVCFPGGRMEAGENPRRTALREISEELLIEEGQAEIWMDCDYLVNPAGMTIYPYLAELHGYRGTFSEEEVESVRLIPLRWFFEHEPDCHTARIVTVPGKDFPFELIPDGEHYRWREGSYEVMFYQYGDFVIWGMTARILKSCVDTLKDAGFEPVLEKGRKDG